MEQRNLDTLLIDEVSTVEMLKMFNAEDKKVAVAVESCLGQIAQVVDMAAACIKAGGRLVYMGSGSSGKMAVMDASECPPTFGVDDNTIVGLISGGKEALGGWREDTEDDKMLAVNDLRSIKFSGKDMLLGVSASGYTPYVLAGIEYARSLGSKVIGLSTRGNSPLATITDVGIAMEVGPEAIMGSTRLKAGTAQKMALNMISSAIMIKLGKTYGNLMADVRPINTKLRQRVIEIIKLSTGKTDEEASWALQEAGGNTKGAILMLLLGVKAHRARQLLTKHEGVVKKAIKDEQLCKQL